MLPTPAARPTMYFIGVTTGSSSIMKVFPRWAAALGRPDVALKGIDLPIHAPREVYREVVRFIKNDPLSIGALVTTHKIDLYAACADLFEYADHYAKAFGELSSISKQGELLCAHAKDPISSGLALEQFVPRDYWKRYGGDVLLMGAGGSSISMGSYLMREEAAGNYPRRIVVTNRSKPRLEAIERIFSALTPGGIELCYHLCPTAEDNDAVLATLPPHSLVVNATGLGKDQPGSPLTDAALFPEDSLAWEINYRGDLKFMHQARAQQAGRRLAVEDGWMYFIFGWTQVIAEVFHTEIADDMLSELSRLAKL
ncbi:MAG: shikimate dehydrogenase [Clostridiales bacterium]|nr:shikimate dehydrogenase [Clostridiales bacterium]